MELRYATTVLISKYNVTFAPGEDNHEVIENMTDSFTVDPGDLKIVWTER